MKRAGARAARLLLAATAIVAAPAAGRTIVEKPAHCTVIVRIPIEISGPAATRELADRWKSEIETEWNGPTVEMIERLAQQLGLDPKKDADELDRLGRELLGEAGIPDGYTRVNCCNVRFVVEVRLGQGTEGWHQIEAVPEFEEKEIRGRRGRVRHRDHVKGSGWAHVDDASGVWSDAPAGRSAAAHEAGHLMGLGDEYEDVVLKKGTGETFLHPETGQPIVVGSRPKPGHELDVMADNPKGWPMEEAIRRIIELGGVKCNCCPEERSVVALPGHFDERLSTYGGFLADAEKNCHESVLASLLDALERLRQGVQREDRLSWFDQAALRLRIRLLVERARRALEECQKKRRVATRGDSVRQEALIDQHRRDRASVLEVAELGREQLEPPPVCSAGAPIRVALGEGAPVGRWFLEVDHELGRIAVELHALANAHGLQGSVPVGSVPGSSGEVYCRSTSGQVVARSAAGIRIVPVESPERGARVDSASELAEVGGHLCVCGNFADPPSWRGLTLGSAALGDPLAASGRVAVYAVPPGLHPGAHALGAATSNGPAVHLGELGPEVIVVETRAELDTERLWRGGSTQMRLEVVGTERPLTLQLVNRSPQVVRLVGGDRRKAKTSGGTPNRFEETVEAVRVGPFVVDYDFELGGCPCAQGSAPTAPGGAFP